MEFVTNLDIPIDENAPTTFDKSMFEALSVLINEKIDENNRQLNNHNIICAQGDKIVIASNILALAKQQYVLTKMYQEFLQNEKEEI